MSPPSDKLSSSQENPVERVTCSPSDRQSRDKEGPMTGCVYHSDGQTSDQGECMGGVIYSSPNVEINSEEETAGGWIYSPSDRQASGQECPTPGGICLPSDRQIRSQEGPMGRYVYPTLAKQPGDKEKLKVKYVCPTFDRRPSFQRGRVSGYYCPPLRNSYGAKRNGQGTLHKVSKTVTRSYQQETVSAPILTNGPDIARDQQQGMSTTQWMSNPMAKGDRRWSVPTHHVTYGLTTRKGQKLGAPAPGNSLETRKNKQSGVPVPPRNPHHTMPTVSHSDTDGQKPQDNPHWRTKERVDHPFQQPIKRRNRRFRRRCPVSDPKQVINLSSTPLTDDQLYVLSLGAKFCPTPGPVKELDLAEDIHEGTRRLRLKEYFHNENTPKQQPARPKFYKKTGWQPPENRDKALEAYCSTIKSLTTAFMPKKRAKRNLSGKHRKALAELRNLVREGKIRISTADKGGSIVVQDLESYKQEALRQLDNTDQYQRVNQDPTKLIAQVSNTLVDRLKSEGTIDDHCHRWAHTEVDSVRTHIFYHLPKVHKDREHPPGRPIVSGVKGPTEKLSKLVDHLLQPIVKTLPSYIKDSTHFLQIIEDWNTRHAPLPSGTKFVTVDVVGLYANIPHGEVQISLQDALDNNQHLLPTGTDKDTLLDVVNHVLTNNILEFDGVLYKQVFGTAMGTPMAPSIANIFMGWWERDMLALCPWNIPSSHWLRYIDDIALLWTHGEGELKKFLNWINSLHPTIKFTANYGERNIPYLDVSVSITAGKLETDLHVKDTDAGMCLPFSSCHPRHCTRSIPYSQCLRLRRICSTQAAFWRRCEELAHKLRRRGYPNQLIKQAITDVSNKPRKDTLQYTSQNGGTERTPFVITHNPENPPLAKWLKNFMPVLHSSSRMRKAVPLPPIVGERKCPNLKKLLMPSSTHSPTHREDTDDAGCRGCGKKCVLCNLHLQTTRTFTSVVTNHRYNIQQKTSCTTSNVVYLLDCQRCKQVQYVGETGQTMKKRFHKHRSDINTKKDTLVARHFCEPSHSLTDLKCTVIEKVRVEDTDVRKQREKFWRWQLKTNFPNGLNVFD